VPCETQQTISSLDTPTGPGPTPKAVPKPTPAGMALQQALTTESNALLGRLIKQQGFPYKLGKSK